MSSDKYFITQSARAIACFALDTTSELHLALESNAILFQVYRNSLKGKILTQTIELPTNSLAELKASLLKLEQTLGDEQKEVSSLPVKQNVLFAHESEREFAKILDFYQIEWCYEPHTFPIRWDEQGNVVESFTPDFYLPEQQQYIELTTLKQQLVTKKNRKVRLLRQTHPEISIKIIYGKDYRQLVAKYLACSEGKVDGPK